MTVNAVRRRDLSLDLGKVVWSGVSIGYVVDVYQLLFFIHTCDSKRSDPLADAVGDQLFAPDKDVLTNMKCAIGCSRNLMSKSSLYSEFGHVMFHLFSRRLSKSSSLFQGGPRVLWFAEQHRRWHLSEHERRRDQAFGSEGVVKDLYGYRKKKRR